MNPTGRGILCLRGGGMAAAVLTGIIGCGGDARVELAAADALQAVAGQVQQALLEYHAAVQQGDDAREAEVITAFVTRVVRDGGDPSALAGHAGQFREALARIRADRAVEWRRHDASMENLEVLQEIADGLQRLGIAALTWHDETRRYLTGWLEARRRAVARVTDPGGAR